MSWDLSKQEKPLEVEWVPLNIRDFHQIILNLYEEKTPEEFREEILKFSLELVHQRNTKNPFVFAMLEDARAHLAMKKSRSSKGGKTRAENMRKRLEEEQVSAKAHLKHILSTAKEATQEATQEVHITEHNITEHNITEHNSTSVDKSTEIKKTKAKKESAEKIPFGDFWNIYPKKVNKNKAEKLWGKLTLEEQRLAMDYVPRYGATREKQFCKAGDGFLLNRTWEDEIVDYKSTKQQQQPQRPFKTARQIDEEEQHRRKVEYDYVDYLIAKGLELPKASALTALVAKTWDFLNGFPPEDPQEVLTAIEAGQPILKLAWSAAK